MAGTLRFAKLCPPYASGATGPAGRCSPRTFGANLCAPKSGAAMIDDRTAPYAALVLRLSLSFLFFAHLYRKFAVIGFDSWWSGLSKQGYPDWTLAYTLGAEFAGAALLLLGIYTRYVSLLTL